MRIAVTGAGGQVGRAVQAVAPEFGAEIVPFTAAQLDVSNARAVRAMLTDARPDAIIHAGAMTNTDGCETTVEQAYTVNALGAGYVAAAAARIGCPVLHVSTNYVFDGERDAPYDEFDAPNPQSVYARSKYAGELAAARTGAHLLIVRTAMVYAEEGKNFLRTMLALAERGIALKVVADQWGQPTYATDLAPWPARPRAKPASRHLSPHERGPCELGRLGLRRVADGGSRRGSDPRSRHGVSPCLCAASQWRAHEPRRRRPRCVAPTVGGWVAAVLGGNGAAGMTSPPSPLSTPWRGGEPVRAARLSGKARCVLLE